MNYEIYFEVLSKTFEKLYEAKDYYEYRIKCDKERAAETEEDIDYEFLHESELKLETMNKLIDQFATQFLKIVK